MTQNQEYIEKNFHEKRVIYGEFALLDHSLLITRNKRSLIGGRVHPSGDRLCERQNLAKTACDLGTRLKV